MPAREVKEGEIYTFKSFGKAARAREQAILAERIEAGKKQQPTR